MDLPVERRYNVTTYSPEGTRARLGRYQLRFIGEHVRAENRTGTTVAELDVTDATRLGSVWTLTAADGTRWELGGCGCGG